MIETIIRVTAAVYGVPIESMTAAGRRTPIQAHARVVAMGLADALTPLKRPVIAPHFGRTPRTIKHARRRLPILEGSDPRIADIRRRLQRLDSTVRAERITRGVAVAYGVPVAAIKSNDCKVHIVWPRRVAIHLIRRFTGWPYSRIAAFLSVGDSIIVTALRVVSRRRANDPIASDRIEKLERFIHART
ncbi:MAG: helix-turn-helix domain-containing protein [Pseudomonadota bacterium]